MTKTLKVRAGRPAVTGHGAALRLGLALCAYAIVGLLLVLVNVAPPTSKAAPPGDIKVVRANQTTTNDQQEPTLAVDPTNPNNVIAAAKDWRNGPKQVWYYRSTDGGRTWADGHVDTGASELPNGSDPVLAFDANGALYLAFIGYNQNELTVGGIFVARSDDAGKTWRKPVLVAAHSDTAFHDKEWITVDRSAGPNRGRIYITWTLFAPEGQHERGDIVASHSTDGGKTFSPPTGVSLHEQDNNQGSFPVVGPKGDLYVLYFSDAPSASGPGGRGLYLAKSEDGGRSFSPAIKAAPVSKPVSPLPGNKFRIFVLPTLAVDPKSGTLYAAWNDFSNDDTDVMLVRSTDGGQTWSAPKRVNNDPQKPRHDQFFPTLTVGSDGVLHMLWLDRRDDPDNKSFEPYYAGSTDGGNTFTQAALSRTPSNPDIGFQGTLIGDYLAVDTSADGSQVYTAWVDTRNGDQDIYFSSFASKAGPGTPAPAMPTRQAPLAVPSPQPLTGFFDAAFMRKWERTDRPVLLGKVSRPWVWGPVSFAAAQEPYAQGKNGTRDVQYFDKARMEINNPNGDITGRFYVTNGLLVVELTSGRIQIGDNQFEAPRMPAQVPVAGDADSPDALTYASLAPVASLNGDKRATDRTGQAVTSVLNKAGVAGDDPTRAGAIRIAKYEPTLGHNIPDVFWTFMNQKGTVQLSVPVGSAVANPEQEAGTADPDRPLLNVNAQAYTQEPVLDWVTDLGYPITEPYWTNVKVAGVQKWVLVQAFQRRVLTYVADNAPGWQVEMGNVGRHYVDWRYGAKDESKVKS